MAIDPNSAELTLLKSKFLFDEPLAKHTALKVGGPAKIMVELNDETELPKLLILAKKQNYPFLVLGNGSNILISDLGFPGMVVKLNSRIEAQEQGPSLILDVSAGTALGELLNYCAQK
ncbi:MAG: FAD-binding protein, partial [Candidatus Margulisiibacteriota bacterium]